jgi:hypothetical protein
MSYETMSDWEINVAVAKALGYDAMPAKFHASAVVTRYIKNGVPSAGLTQKDYCNNPSDAWPIILSNKIGIRHCPSRNQWWAFNDKYQGFGAHEIESGFEDNPLLAAMIVFLKMSNITKEGVE